MPQKFFINPFSVIFHRQLDKKNDCETIVCSWESVSYLKINKTGYKILQLIEKFPGITLGQIVLNFRRRENSVGKFVTEMVKQKVDLTKDND